MRLLLPGPSDSPDPFAFAALALCARIGRHSPDHARALAEADVLRRLLAVYLHQDSSEDLRTKAFPMPLTQKGYLLIQVY